MLGVDENDELIDVIGEGSEEYGAKQSFPQMILENLKTAGVQQAHKEDKITFTALTPWPGDLVCAEGRYLEGEAEKRAAIFIGPEFGTVQRADLVAAAREAGDAGFDVLIACAFNYEAHTTEFSKLGRVPVLKARMNADLHMAEDLKNTGKGNLAKYLVTFSTTDRLEHVHPLQGGILRLKHPSERRLGFPRERSWIFWPRFAWDTLRKHAILAGTIGRLLVWKTAIARDPDARGYMDQALTPVGDDEDETLDLLTKTAGGRAAVAHIKKVAELTGTDLAVWPHGIATVGHSTRLAIEMPKNARI